MSNSESQLRQTFKILTFEFIRSIQKIAALSGERLLYSKHNLFSKIVDLLKCHKGAEVFEDYSKMLENSNDDGVKYDCFEKDLSLSINESSQPRDIQSDMDSEIHGSPKNSFDDQTDKIKREILSNQRFTQLTKYTGNPNEIFQYVNSFDQQCKQEQEQTPIKKLKLNIDISEFPQIPLKQVKKEEENHEESKEIEEITPEQNDSSFTPDEYFGGNPEEQQNEIENKPTCKTRSASTSQQKTKKYRSYSENLKQQAIKYAFEMGPEFTSRALQIPKKNISRWMRKKEENAGIRGRKPGDPTMEKNLTNWIKWNIGQAKYVTQTEIRKKAREFADSKAFKASKGWLQKYFRRNKLIGDALNSLLYLKKVKNTIDLS